MGYPAGPEPPISLQEFAALGAAPLPGEDPDQNIRTSIFNRIRDPNNIEGSPERNMPRLHNDGTGNIDPESLRLTVTKTQFEMLRKWAMGQFNPDWAGVPTPATTVTAEGLDRAALEAACGGSFFPGMETGWILRDKRIYADPFRLRHASSETDPTGTTPGDLTKRSALPWQADFLKCGNNWWPAQRPNQVRLNPNSTSTAEWSRSINGHVELVEKWSLLGIVVPSANPASPSRFHESERELP
jgi:L-lysine epsilon oxidase C-terminal domain